MLPCDIHILFLSVTVLVLPTCTVHSTENGAVIGTNAPSGPYGLACAGALCRMHADVCEGRCV